MDVHANENMPIPGSDEYWRCRRQAFVLIRNLEPGPGRYFRTVHHDDAASNPVVREILKAQNRLHLLTPAKGFEELGSVLDDLAKTAHKGCGLVYELYAERFTAAVDREVDIENLSPTIRDQAQRAAAYHGYMTREEREAQDEMLSAAGCCVHGLDRDCCPCGCGDL